MADGDITVRRFAGGRGRMRWWYNVVWVVDQDGNDWGIAGWARTKSEARRSAVATRDKWNRAMEDDHSGQR